MAQLLEGLPMDFVITGKEIVIKTKPVTTRADRQTARTTPSAQQQSVTGRVLDEHGTPLQGAAVRVKGTTQARSEEHTSELQSRENLVSRPLLEKKNINNDAHDE